MEDRTLTVMFLKRMATRAIQLQLGFALCGTLTGAVVAQTTCQEVMDSACPGAVPSCVECVPMTVELESWRYLPASNSVHAVWKQTWSLLPECYGPPSRVDRFGWDYYAPDVPTCAGPQAVRLYCNGQYGFDHAEPPRFVCTAGFCEPGAGPTAVAVYCPPSIEHTVVVPRMRPGHLRFGPSLCLSDVCGDGTGGVHGARFPVKTRFQVTNDPFLGGTSDWHAIITRTVLASSTEVEGSSVTHDISSGELVLGSCGVRTIARYAVRETCGGTVMRTWDFTANDGCTDELFLKLQRNQLGILRSRFHIRSSPAVMGVRGFNPVDTVVRGVQLQSNSTIRWARLTDAAVAASERKGLPLVPEYLEDGALASGSSASGTHSPTLIVSGYADADAGDYIMFEIPAGGTVREASQAELFRIVSDDGRPFITSEPRDIVLCPSQIADAYPESPALELTVGATSSDQSEPLYYQWYINGERLQGFYAGYINSLGDSIGIWRGEASSPSLGLYAFSSPGNPGEDGSPARSVTFWAQCEVFNSHGSVLTREIPVTIDLSMNDCDGDGTTDACEIAAGAPDMNADFIPDGCQCLGDVDGNGAVGGADLGMMLSSWSQVANTGTAGACDLNGDGAVSGADLGVLLSNWGPCRH